MNLLIDGYYVAALAGYPSARQLFLKVKPIDEDRPATQVILMNFRELNPPNPSIISPGPQLQILMPLRDFEDIYRILQTEKPVYLQLEGDRPHPQIRLGTFAEPVGEGPEDTSP